MEELYILLTPNKEHKNVFPNVSVIGFQNGKSVVNYLVKAILPIFNESGRCESMSFTTDPCQETFKIVWSLTCDSEKVLYLFIFKLCVEVPLLEKAKTRFCCRFINCKSKRKG